MKKKKYGVFAVTAAALFMMALLITNCAEPLNITNQNRARTTRGAPPPNMGRVTVQLTEVSGARTILPTVPTFQSFLIVVRTAPPTGTPIEVFNIYYIRPDNVNNLPGPSIDTEDEATIYLPAGAFRITVYAYVDDFSPANPQPPLPGDLPPGQDPNNVYTRPDLRAARGTSQVINVTAGNSFTAEVRLQAIFTGTGQGTFDWDIDLSATGIPTPPIAGDHASLILEPLSGQTLTPSGNFTVLSTSPRRYTLDLLVTGGTNLIDDLDIPVGFYQVTTLVRRDGFRDRRVIDILHIAQNMTSYYDPTIAALIDLRHAITFVDWDGRGSGPTPPATATVNRTLQYMHNQILTDNPAFAPLAQTPPVALPSTYGDFYPQPTFYRLPNRRWMGWWTEDGRVAPALSWGTEWYPSDARAATSATTRLTAHRFIRATTLYARWEPFSPTELTIFPPTMVNLAPTPPAVGPVGPATYWTQNTFANESELRIDLGTGLNVTNIRWYGETYRILEYGGGSADGLGMLLGEGNPLVLNFDANPLLHYYFNVVGLQRIAIIGMAQIPTELDPSFQPGVMTNVPTPFSTAVYLDIRAPGP